MTNAKTPAGLSVELEQFAAMIASGASQTEALMAIWPNTRRWTDGGRRTKASARARQPLVAARIRELMAAGAEVALKTVEDVHRRLALIAFADLRELTGVRVGACRHCWGEGHRYHRTPKQREEAYAAWQALPRAKRKKFDEAGGIGYDPRREPNPDCPECWGRGEADHYVADTRKLSKAGAAVFGGIEVLERGGIRVRTRDQDAAIDKLARIIGAYKADNQQPADALGQFLRELSGNVIGPRPPDAKQDDDDSED